MYTGAHTALATGFRPKARVFTKGTGAGERKLCSFSVRRRGDMKGSKLRGVPTQRLAICRHARAPGYAWQTKTSGSPG